MSLDTTLARISELETAFLPPSSKAATTAPGTTGATPATGVSSNFATQLQGALGTAAAPTTGLTPTAGVAPTGGVSAGTGGANAMVQIAQA